MNELQSRYDAAQARYDAAFRARDVAMQMMDDQDDRPWWERLPAAVTAEIEAATKEFRAAETALYGTLREQAAVARGKGFNADAEWE